MKLVKATNGFTINIDFLLSLSDEQFSKSVGNQATKQWLLEMKEQGVKEVPYTI